jgi:predicted Zn-dependent protease with MMP-like domain
MGVHITVVHEIAHHFGIDDERLHEPPRLTLATTAFRARAR